MQALAELDTLAGDKRLRRFHGGASASASTQNTEWSARKQLQSDEKARIAALKDEVTAWRRDIHAHPELGFEEERTSAIVAAKLREYGCEVTTGIARTGIVGTIRVGNSPRAIGLRRNATSRCPGRIMSETKLPRPCRWRTSSLRRAEIDCFTL